MKRKPRVDTRVDPEPVPAEWHHVLAHRDPADMEPIASRFRASGLTPAQVRDTLADGGDGIYAAARTEDPGWAEPFGGPLGVALLAAEVSACAAHVSSRAARVRAVAVNQLLDGVSAVTVADRLGVSRQKVYDLVRNDQVASYIDTVPWRQP